MKIPKLLAAMMLALCCLQANGQDVVDRINEIKLDQKYVYGEATHENEDSAFMEAMMVMKINLETRLKANVDYEQLRARTKHISRPRGNRVKVMAYVEVDEIPVSSTSSKPTISVHLAKENQADATPPAGNPASPTPPAPVSPPASAPSPPSASHAALAPLVTQLMETEHLQGAVSLLDAAKKAGTIGSFAPYAKAANPAAMYLLVFDKEYNIPLAVLSPEKANGKRDNLVTNKEETLSDYKNNMAVCFSLP